MPSDEHTEVALNTLAEEVSATASEKGFWEAFTDADFLEELASLDGQTITLECGDELRRIADALRTMTLGNKLMLMVSELVEAHDELRVHGAGAILNGEGDFGEELADVIIRVLDTAGVGGTVIGTEVAQKAEKNKSRPHKHGKKF